jgi:putative ABC transport system permease protein
MIKHILRTVFRRIKTNYKINILTLSGLALGIASGFIIFTKVMYEKSFDNFHSGSKNIYRVVRLTSGLKYLNGDLEYRAGIHFPVPGEIKKTIPEATSVASLLYVYGNKIFTPNNNSQKPVFYTLKDGIVFADSQFFEVFDYAHQPIPWIAGNKTIALNDVFSVVITREIEKLLFHSESAMGRVINIGGGEFTVKGVIDNFPVNSDFPFKILISLSTYTERIAKGITSNWGSISDNFQCFVKLNNDAKVDQVNQKLNNIIKDHLPAAEAAIRSMKLQPLKEVHRDERFGNFNNHTISNFILNALSVLAIFILVIVGLNFSNGMIAQSIKNNKDTSIRRIVGCGKLEIFNAFFIEALILTLTASVFGLFIAYFAFETQSDLIGIPKTFYTQFDYKSALMLLSIILLISVIASIFPGIFFTSKKPLSTLKQNERSLLGNKNKINKATIIIQFTTVTVLIISTVIISKQLIYIHNKDLGYNPQNIISAGIPENTPAKISSLNVKLIECPAVAGISLCSGNPAEGRNWFGVSMKYKDEPIQFDSELKYTDTSYFNLNGFKFIAGSIYAKNDSFNSVIVNKEFVAEAGIKNPAELIGAPINGVNSKKTIVVGVVNNSHSVSLHQKLRPCVFVNNNRGFYKIEIKLKTTNASDRSKQLAQITSIWKDIFPDDNFEFSFLTEQINNFYKGENNLFRMLLLFTFMTTFLCCLGIFGLSVFISEQKTKEIGIRKVNGAQTNQILLMLNSEYVKWIVAAFIFACPISWYIMNKWLQNFAYKTDLSWWVFIVAGIIALLVALITVNWHSYRVATRNPVVSLRYE